MNVHVARTADAPVRRKLSVDDLRRMIEAGIIENEERVELFDGELFEMNAKGFAHELIKGGMIRLLVQRSSDAVFVGVEPSLRLDTHVLLEPDILVCRRPDVVPSPEGYIGVPGPSVLLVVEVSDSTLRKDRGPKAKLYARYGVPEYWIVDVKARAVLRHLEPAPAGYGSVGKVAGDDELVPASRDLAEVRIRLVDLI